MRVRVRARARARVRVRVRVPARACVRARVHVRVRARARARVRVRGRARVGCPGLPGVACRARGEGGTNGRREDRVPPALPHPVCPSVLARGNITACPSRGNITGKPSRGFRGRAVQVPVEEAPAAPVRRSVGEAPEESAQLAPGPAQAAPARGSSQLEQTKVITGFETFVGSRAATVRVASTAAPPEPSVQE